MSRHSSKVLPLPISSPAATRANALTNPRQSRASRDLRVLTNGFHLGDGSRWPNTDNVAESLRPLVLPGKLAITQDFEPNLRVRVPTHHFAADNDIVGRPVKRKARPIAGRPVDVGGHLHFRTIHLVSRLVSRRGVTVVEALRGSCASGGKNSQNRSESGKIDPHGHGLFSFSECALKQEASVADVFQPLQRRSKQAKSRGAEW